MSVASFVNGILFRGNESRTNLLATVHMPRICCSLTLDATVPADATASAAPGRHTDLVRAGGIGAGLGGPITGIAQEVDLLIHHHSLIEYMLNIHRKSI